VDRAMKSYAIVLQGQANGGSVTVRVIANGVAADTVQTTRPGQRPRQVLDGVLDQMTLPTYDVPVKKVDRDGGAMLIVGADSVQTLSNDTGLEIFEQAFDGEVGLKPGLKGGAIRALPMPVFAGNLPSSDLAVLSHLERFIGSMADGSAATPKLLKAALDAHRTFAQGTLAYLTGTPLPVEPNPGNGGTIALDGDSAQSVLSGLASSSVNVLQAVSNLADARSQQLAAAADKEKEAKKGGGATTGSPSGTTPSPGGSGGGATPAGDGAGTGHPKEGTPDTGQPTDGGQQPYAGPKFKPSGAPDTEWEPLDPVCKVKVTTIRGMTFVRGYFPDGKVYLSSGQKATMVDDGRGHVWLEPQFEHFTILIDDAKFEAMIARMQEEIRAENAKAAAEEGWHADWPKIVSNLLSAVPVVGQIKTVLEGLFGVDLVTWEKLDDSTRAIYLLTALAFSPVGARMFRGLKAVSKSALGALKTAIEEEQGLARAMASVDQTATKAALKEAEELAAQAAKETAEKGIETECRECEVAATAEAEQGCRVHVCFGAGTLVRLADETWSAIERIRAGELVLTRSVFVLAGASDAFDAEDPPRHVVRTFAREAEDCLRLEFERDGKRAEIVCTQNHPFAVSGVFRPASTLLPGTIVDTRNGRGARLILREMLPGRRPVFNLEIADGHTYFVTELELWVHNQCERASQRQMEGHIARNPDKYAQPYVDANGNPVSEPAFYKGKYINKSRAEVQAEIDTAFKQKKRLEDAFNQGQATRSESEEAKEYWELLKKRRGDMTFPDAVVTDLETGETLALELKTVKVKGGVEGRFNYAHPDVDYGLTVMEQAADRARLLPSGMKQVLVIDMRAKFPQLFRLTGDAAKQELERLMEREVKTALSTGIWASADASVVKDMWKDIRFLTGPDGAVDLIGGFSLK
jgi:hypothetical protein